MLLFERRFTDGKCEKLYIRVTYAQDLDRRDVPNIRKYHNYDI